MQQPFSFAQPHTSLRGHSILEYKAEIFSILKTAGYLRSCFDQGTVEDIFYYKRLKQFQAELVGIQHNLSKKNRSLLDLVKSMPIPDHLRTIMTVISSVQDYSFNELARTWQQNPHKLAAVASEITTAFITLIDYLHLVQEIDDGFLQELIGDLKSHLNRLKTFQHFLQYLELVEREISQTLMVARQQFTGNPIQMKAEITKIEQLFYELFQDFKKILTIPAST